MQRVPASIRWGSEFINQPVASGRKVECSGPKKKVETLSAYNVVKS